MECTAIFVLEPASLAIPFIWTMPSCISGTSISNKRFTRPGWLLETNICGPLVVFFTSRIYILSLSFTLYSSVGTCSAAVNMPSAFPKSTNTVFFSILWIILVTISFSFSINSLYIIPLSASRMRCTTTCFAV